jgi:acyl-coenzyme A thioesterase PaaI-like protein
MKEDSLPTPSGEKLLEINKIEHQHCFTHVAKDKGGLGLEFRLQPDGSVRAEWDCMKGYESYEGILHGGIQATLMDSAMVQALFARGIVARTGEMKIRFRNSVLIAEKVSITADLVLAHPPLYKMKAAVLQNGRVCAECEAKFMSKF